MRQLHADFVSQYTDRNGLKYAVYGNYTSLPADGSELGRDADMIHVDFHKREEPSDTVFINKPEKGEIYIRLSNFEWVPGFYRNQKFVPSATAFDTWLQGVILENYRKLEAQLKG